jgi:hypothetical protein
MKLATSSADNADVSIEKAAFSALEWRISMDYAG